MQISIIAALASNRVIGNKNQLPWHIPGDFQWFKQQTMNKPIVMGKHTFYSIGKALPNRINIVLTSEKNFAKDNVLSFSSLDDALANLQTYDEIMIIGGEHLYAKAIPIASKMYLTIIDKKYSGDRFFPKYDSNQWKKTFISKPHEHAGISYHYEILETIR